MKTSRQPTLFDTPGPKIDLENVILFALGEFQARGHRLAGRTLPFDRLRGSFRRAIEFLNTPETSETQIIAALNDLGATVTRLPDFVAKWPFRISISDDLAERAALRYSAIKNKLK